MSGSFGCLFRPVFCWVGFRTVQLFMELTWLYALRRREQIKWQFLSCISAWRSVRISFVMVGNVGRPSHTRRDCIRPSIGINLGLC